MVSLNTKKKICIDISNLIPGKGGSGGGIATYTLNLLKGLNEIGSTGNAEIICLKHPCFVGLDNCSNIKFKNFSLQKNIVLRLYWTHIYLPFFCISNKIDLLHKVTPELPLIKVCKYICTLHDLMFEYYLSNKDLRKHLRWTELIKFYFFRKITKHAVFISDAVIVPSEAIKNEVAGKFKMNEHKIFFTHEATEERKIVGTEAASWYGEKLNIGVIAGFHPHKGHKKVLQLANKFVQSGFTNFSISFRGAAPFKNYFNEIQLLKEKLKLSDYVFFLPFEAGKTLDQIYSTLDIVLLLSEYEGFGLPILEAQAHGLPVLCSDLPVFKEILGDSGYYIGREMDDYAINKIIADLKNKTLLRAYISKGCDNLKKYSWGKMSEQTNQIYVRVMDNKRV